MDAAAPASDVRGLAAADTKPVNVFRDMSILYVKASAFAVGAFVILLLTDSNFTVAQTVACMLSISFFVPVYVTIDILVIRRHVRPIVRHFERERAADVDEDGAVEALICLLNLPWRTVVRILTVHGPLAGLITAFTIVFCEFLFDIEFTLTQSFFLVGFATVFATPAHALFEYFAVARYCEGLLGRVWPHCGGRVGEITGSVIQLGLRPKLIGLILFVSTIPIVFLASSIIVKLGEVVGGIENIATEVYVSVGSVTVLCLIGGLSATLVMAREVASHVTEMLKVMNKVERGDLNQELTIVSADEYMELYRGFNLMIQGLRSEIEMLEVTKDLSGEIHLDALLGRLMQSAASLLGAERASVFLYDAKTDELWSRFAMGMETGDIRFPASSGIAGHVFRTGALEQVDDAYADARFNPAVDRELGFRTRNILCIPILSKSGSKVGVTQVINKRAGAFTQRDAQRLMAFTAQVAVSLENAQLFDEVLQVKNYNENILASASDAIVTVEVDGSIIKINDAGLRLLADGTDPVGRDIRTLFKGTEETFLTAMDRVIHTGRPYAAPDVEFTNVAGKTVSANIKVDALTDGEGEIIGALLSFEDLSDEKRLKTSMSRYLSKDIVDQVMDGGLDALGGTDQEVSVLFSDIRSFSSISEELQASDIVEMLNDYFTRMVDEIFANEGVLDKFIGDAIMAIYGTPFPKPEDATNAVRSAIGMFRELDGLNAQRVARGDRPIHMGIGVNSGRAVVGNIGSPKRMEYTVIGDAVNLASRVESLTKHYAAEILVTRGTRALLAPDIAARELDLIAVKGKDQPDVIYEIIRPGGPSDWLLGDGVIERFESGIAMFRDRRFEEALTHFSAFNDDHPSDRASAIYLERCGVFMVDPPAEDWDGVWRFDTK